MSDRKTFTRNDVTIHLGDAIDLYATWPTPTCIVSDGAYGVGGFPGDPPTPDDLDAWYAPHVAAWSLRATLATTLWFWNTEIGWATVHPVLVKNGWRYVASHTWDKGKAHIAGNVNTKTLRHLPIVTEVCVQYVRAPQLMADLRDDGRCVARTGATDIQITLAGWLRQEWTFTSLPMRLANAACGVRDAATRKYLAVDHRWYMPPPEAFVAMAAYADEHGDPKGRPYFTIDGKIPTAAEWAALRPPFACEFGVTNVWSTPSNTGRRSANAKPLGLVERLVRATTTPGDVVWEPFGGTCPAALVAWRHGRRAVAAECLPNVFQEATRSLLVVTR